MEKRCTGSRKDGSRCSRSSGLDEFGRCYQHPIDEGDPPQLTDKQRRFVEEYVVDFNATKAALRAGYSRDTARQMGSENLAKPVIKEALATRFDALAMQADEVVARLSDDARASISPFLKVDEGLLAVDLTSEEAQAHWHQIKELRFDQWGRPIIKLVDSQQAKVQIGRIRNLFREQVDVTFTDARAARLREKAADLDNASDLELEEIMEALASGDLTTEVEG